MIDIAVFDEHNLVLQGITTLLRQNHDFRIIFSCHDRNMLTEKLKHVKVNILILNIYDISVRNLNFIVQLRINNPGAKILIISGFDGEEIVLKACKSGAKGFLGKDSTLSELTEAIYTLRNGHDYFDKSFTNIILNRYISGIDSVEPLGLDEIKQLSARQIEILKLMGDSLSNQEIADKLFISVRTVETHKNHIMQKLNLRTQVDMIKFAIRNNIIEI